MSKVKSHSLVYRYLNEIPTEALILDRNGVIVFANRAYEVSKNLTNMEGGHFRDVITRSLLDNSQLEKHFYQCLETKTCIRLDNIKYESSQQMEKTVNITFSPLSEPGEIQVMLTFRYTTETEELRFQLEIIRELGFYMVGTLDVNRLLFLILTGVTAGPALGFNRAFIMLVDNMSKKLVRGMGVGPTSMEEAGNIWSQVSTEKRALRDFLHEYDVFPNKSELPMSILTDRLQCELSESSNILVQCVNKKKIFHVKDSPSDDRVSPEFLEIYKAREFIVIPLISEENVVGVLVADNMFNNQPISDKHKRFLDVFTFLAGVTIQNATRHLQLENTISQLRDAFKQLDEAGKRMASMEQFATVGRTAGFVAHEIRNPLTTIGGFARSTLKSIDNQAKVIRNAKIIVTEVKRLEELLTNVLDYLRQPDPVITQGNINLLLDDIAELNADAAEEKGIRILVKKQENLPTIAYDRRLMKQALLNLVQNAISFSPKESYISLGSDLAKDKVKLLVMDHGKGISEENKSKLFTPFFTTKDVGSGLGLPITQRIINAHHGQIQIHSEPDKGTTVEILLPIS